MCGFSGFVDFNNKITREHLINAMDTLLHRGPDDGGTEIFSAENATIGFAHRRLSILDISSLAHQPMFNDDKSIVLMLNGTVYNFKEIGRELEQKGYHFISTSDTEVIIKAYQEYGMACLNKLIGMFSLAIYDTRKQKVILARDRAGVKPLYYYYKDGSLLFGSELKALHQYPGFKKEINKEALSLYFKYGYIRAPYSIFQDTYKVKAGHYIELDLTNRSLTQHQYWNVLDYYNKPKINISEADAIDELERLCTSAFQYRLVSDVPVGVFLSGGYDSSLVTAILQKNNTAKIKTFTIGFNENKFNEAEYAKGVAQHLGTDHYEYYCTTREAQEIIPTLPFFYDEPFGDSSAIPTMLVSGFARKYVTSALSADGGDEIFAGYSRYDQLLRINKLKKSVPDFVQKISAQGLRIFPGSAVKKEKLVTLLYEKDPIGTYDVLNRHFMQPNLQKIVNADYFKDTMLFTPEMISSGGNVLDDLLAVDYQTYMADDILTKVDRATMSIALEGREPLLDHRIVEWAAQLPVHLKYNNGNKKYLAKKLTHKYIPKEIMDRPKMGFGIPLEKWLKGDLRELMQQTLSKENIRKYGVLNEKAVENLAYNYFNGATKNNSQLWLVFMFQLWCKQWL